MSYQLTETDKANGWTAEQAAAYHAHRERVASDLIRESMERRMRQRQRPRRCQNDYDPMVW